MSKSNGQLRRLDKPPLRQVRCRQVLVQAALVIMHCDRQHDHRSWPDDRREQWLLLPRLLPSSGAVQCNGAVAISGRRPESKCFKLACMQCKWLCKCSIYRWDRDLPQAYGRDGGRLDRGGPKVFPSSKASEVMMWCAQTLLSTLGKSKRSAFHRGDRTCGCRVTAFQSETIAKVGVYQ